MYLFYKRQKSVLEDQVPVFSEEISSKKFVDECLPSFRSSGNSEWQIQLPNEYICVHIYCRQSWNIPKQKRLMLWKRDIKVTLVSKAVASLWKVWSAGGKPKNFSAVFVGGKCAASGLPGVPLGRGETSEPAFICVCADEIWLLWRERCCRSLAVTFMQRWLSQLAKPMLLSSSLEVVLIHGFSPFLSPWYFSATPCNILSLPFHQGFFYSNN